MRVVLMAAPRAVGEVERKGLPFLSLGYIASSLLLDKHDVSIVDAHTLNLSVQEAVGEALKYKPDILGISSNTHNRFAAIEVIRKIKSHRPDLKIFVGGPHFGLTGHDALRVVPQIDFIIKGEGEITSCELLKTGFGVDKLAGVLGLIYRDAAGQIIENPDRPFIRNLDELPMPAWQLFDLKKYQGTTQVEGSGLKSIGVISSRGCPNRCIFCSSLAIHRGMLRLRSAKNFVDEIEYLYQRHGYRAFDFWDDTFTVVRHHAVEVCEEIIRRGLKIHWYTPCRVNTVDEELLALMKKAGCARVNFGIESGSPKILKIMKKGIMLEQARTAVAAALKVGLEVTLNFLIVFPHETWQDLAMTADLIKEFKKMPKVKPSYGFIMIYPGTELEQIAKKEGLMPEDFSWNSPYRSEKYRLTGEDPSVPYFEWPGLPFEEVKAFVLRRIMTRTELWKSFSHKLSKAKNWREIKLIFKVVNNYLRSFLRG